MVDKSFIFLFLASEGTTSAWLGLRKIKTIVYDLVKTAVPSRALLPVVRFPLPIKSGIHITKESRQQVNNTNNTNNNNNHEASCNQDFHLAFVGHDNNKSVGTTEHVVTM